eukprot:XP_797866.3 PREDICTED: NADPH oxidase 5-like [Strongylocentrotus purpuratus]
MTGRQGKDGKWLVRLEKHLHEVAGDDNLIDLDEFINALNVKESFFAERFFELNDKDQSGSISLEELIVALRLLVNGTEQQKLHFLFQVYDVDGSGFIDVDELRTVLRSCTDECALTLPEETLTELTEILFADADVDGDGEVSFEELSEQLQRYPGITSNLSFCAAEWLNPKKKKPKSQSRCSYHALRNNFSVIIFWIVFVIINVGLAAWGAYEGYRSVNDERHPAAIIIARSAGRCLSFECCFVLVLMLRKLLTILRNTFLMSVLPLDQHVIIHKIVAIFIIILSVIHTAGHIANIGLIYQVENVNGTTAAWIRNVLVRPFPGLGLVEGSCIITGILIIIVLIIMTICSLPFIRRNGYFKVFYWTHQLCIVFWCLIIIHSKYFWIWFIAPGIIYLAERLLRFGFFRRARFGKVYIQKGYVLPANVVHLVIQRPANFRFHAGEYIHVNIPSISFHEWHPFTISSAPEQQDFLTLHIRCVGHWTKRLYNVVRERQLALLEDEPGFGEIDKEHDSPLEVIVEVSSTKSTSAVESNSQQSTTSDIPIDNNGRRSSKTYNKRRRTARGATNLGFVPELPNGDKDGTKTVTEGKPYNTGQNDDESLAQKVNPTQLSLPRKADHPSASQGDCQPMPHKELGEISMTLAVNGNSFKMKSLNSRQSIDVQEAPRGNTTKRQSLRVRLSLAGRQRRSVCGKPNGDVNRKMSLVTLRRNGARHSLDLSKDLGGTPHTGLEVILDGPYGAPAQHIMEAEHAVLIGAGIGITPFASILQSIHERYKAAKKQCPNCNHTWVTDTSSILKTKKVDFFWINRDQHSFEWFISLISAIELEQAEIPAADRFLDIHLYMTSALLPIDMKAIGLHVALDLIHKKKNRDTITGLKTRTQAGRPDWDEVFQNLKQQHKGKITVFFCGSPALGKILSTKCLQYHMEFRKENF